jgi:hypothetical protein
LIILLERKARDWIGKIRKMLVLGIPPSISFLEKLYQGPAATFWLFFRTTGAMLRAVAKWYQGAVGKELQKYGVLP